MGLSGNFVCDLAELKRRGATDGITNVMEIGAQQLSNSFLRSTEVTDELFRLYNRAPPALLGAATLGNIPDGYELLPDDAPSSRFFWESLGFRYAALDFDGHRDSTAIDLNKDTVPRRLRGNFGLVVNTGTTEHVANQDNAFRVIHDLAAVGGVMIHELPASGMMTHGLFGYNMKFFWLLCRENEYEVIYLKIYSHPPTAIPDDIFASNIEFSGAQHLSITEVPAFTIRAALRKKNDRPFVTPLDIPAITKTVKPVGLFGRALKAIGAA
jgi:hypothetical protein